MRSMILVLAAIAGLLAAPAHAQRAGQGWSVLGATSVGDGDFVLHGQFGYPGLSVDFLHGMGSVDLGLRAGYNYAFEGWTTRYYQRNGLRAQALLRLNVLQGQRVNLGLRFEPGFFAYFTRRTTDSALVLPIGATLGIPVSSALNVALTLDVPLFVLWGNGIGAFGGDGVYVPILFGAGLEYFVDRNVALTAQTKMGPTLLQGGGANFTLQVLFGVAVKF